MLNRGVSDFMLLLIVTIIVLIVIVIFYLVLYSPSSLEHILPKFPSIPV